MSRQERLLILAFVLMMVGGMLWVGSNTRPRCWISQDPFLCEVVYQNNEMKAGR